MDRLESDDPSRLGGFEELVLLAAQSLHPDGYAVAVGERLEQEGERTITLGAVYATLDRLERKGLVVSRLGDGTPERGGRRKRLYRITAEGVRALQYARAVRTRLWALRPRLREL
jgi:PadR family transcriptional regulator, regulatory protein PadR